MPYNWRNQVNISSEDKLAIASEIAKIDFKNDADRKALAEVFTQELREIIERDDIISALGVESVTFEKGQTPQWVTRKGLKAFVHEPGSYAPRSTLTNRVQTLYTERISVNPEIEITQLKSGRYGTINEMKRFALEELMGRKYGIIWSTLIGSVPTTTAAPQYLTVASTASSAAKKAAIDSGLDYVADQQGSNVVAIVGRRSTLSFLADYNAYGTQANAPSENRRVTLDNQLYPETYRGIPVVMLNQYKDGYGVNVITTNEIMIIGRDTVKLGITHPLDSMEGMNADTLMWNIHYWEDYGVGVFNPERNCRIKLT